MDRDDDGSDRREPRTGGSAGRGRPGSSRRGFLAAVVATGLGGGLANASGDVVRTSLAHQVPIVYAYVRADPTDPTSLEPRTRTVPAAWLEGLRRGLEANRKLRAAGVDDFLGSFVVPGDAADPGAAVSVRGTDGGVREAVASVVPDVEVDVEVIDSIPDPTADGGPVRPSTVADLGDASVPGGVFCGADRYRGSLAPALYDPSTGRRFFATANHLFAAAADPGEHRGTALHLVTRDGREPVGRVRRSLQEEDLAVVEPTGRYTPASEVADAEPGTVRGQFTKLGLADLMARGEPLEMTAAISGHATGAIKGIDGTTVYTGRAVRTGQLVWGDEETFTDGDSGSVTYHADPEDDGYLLVAGMNSARTWWPGADFTWGTAAYRIREAHGYVF